MIIPSRRGASVFTGDIGPSALQTPSCLPPPAPPPLPSQYCRSAPEAAGDSITPTLPTRGIPAAGWSPELSQCSAPVSSALLFSPAAFCPYVGPSVGLRTNRFVGLGSLHASPRVLNVCLLSSCPFVGKCSVSFSAYSPRPAYVSHLLCTRSSASRWSLSVCSRPSVSSCPSVCLCVSLCPTVRLSASLFVRLSVCVTLSDCPSVCVLLCPVSCFCPSVAGVYFCPSLPGVLFASVCVRLSVTR